MRFFFLQFIELQYSGVEPGLALDLVPVSRCPRDVVRMLSPALRPTFLCGGFILRQPVFHRWWIMSHILPAEQCYQNLLQINIVLVVPSLYNFSWNRDRNLILEALLMLLYSETPFVAIPLNSTNLFAVNEIKTGRRDLVEWKKNPDLGVSIVLSLISYICDFGKVLLYKWSHNRWVRLVIPQVLSSC